MSGFAYSLKMSTALTPAYMDKYVPEEEAAGKVGKWLGVIAAVIVPFAAPAIFGAIASSGVLGAGLATAASTGTLSGLASTLGSAVVGGLMNAGVAYASGARGGAVWQAAGMGALQGGMGGLSRAASATNATNAAYARTQAVLNGGGMANTGAAASGLSVPGIGGGMIELGAGGSQSGGMLGTIAQRIGTTDPTQLNRLGAAIINAAVNGQQLAGMDDLVAQQRAELAALAQTNQAAYQQRISEAQNIIRQADQMDPGWMGRIAMADVQGAESRAADQAMRNIAVRQGGSFDDGQRKAYERGAALHTARSKSLAYNQAFKQAQTNQTQIRAQGVGLLGPDNFGLQLQQSRYGLEADALRGRGELMADTAGAFSSALFGQRYNPATSPDPTSNYEDEENNNTFGSFGSGN